jgi:hypothetical protein
LQGDEEPLFPNPIEAWANGPVVRDLPVQHRGRFTIDGWPEETQTRSPAGPWRDAGGGLREHLLGDGLAHKTVHKVLTLLHGILARAKRKGWICSRRCSRSRPSPASGRASYSR